MAIPGSFQYPQAQAPGLPAPVTGTPATPGQVGVGAGRDWWRALLEQLGITLPQGGFPQAGRINFRTANRQPGPQPFTGAPRQQAPVENLAAAPRQAEQFGPVTLKNGVYLPDQQSRFSTMQPSSWLSTYLRG